MDNMQMHTSKEGPSIQASERVDEYDSGSDVSVSPSDIESSSHPVQERPAGPDLSSGLNPDANPQQQAQSPNTIKQRLLELEGVDNVLTTKRKKLIAKRVRKDERIQSRLALEDARVKLQQEQKDARRGEEDAKITQELKQERARREEEDAKIKREREQIDAHLEEQISRIRKEREQEDAHYMEEESRRAFIRTMKDERIRKRREREDAEFCGQEQAHDGEELELRRRLICLKRGRPLDLADRQTVDLRTTTSSESTSPPAKKHRPDPAAKQVSNSPPIVNALQPQQPQQDQHIPPQYSYYYGWNHPLPLPPPPSLPHPSGPYTFGPGEPYQPRNQPIPPPNNQVLLATMPVGGPPPFNPPAPPPTHGPSPMVTPPPPHAQSTRDQVCIPAPPSGPSHYDVRPPSATSNFMSINAQSSGFPSVNQPPKQAVVTPIRPASKSKRANQSSAKSQPSALELGVQGSPTHRPSHSPTTSPANLSGKRKASTTHPYSQSEAFANRHQHCDRTDELDRGIWTYFGPGGTKEAPTVAGKKEMYLRCDHNDCMRLDWKTIHGLQCHIVKNHGVAKGTIGSLELALGRYGVEVQEVEEHEKKHGLGSAGNMVEKAPRSRQRPHKASDDIDLPQASEGKAGAIAAPKKPSPAARLNPAGTIVLFPNLAGRNPTGGYVQDDIVYSEDESDGDEPTMDIKHAALKRIIGPVQSRASKSEIGMPSTLTTGADEERRQSTPHATLIQQMNSHRVDKPKSPEPVQSSSTGKSAGTDGAPPSNENFVTHKFASTSPRLIPHVSPTGTEAQRSDSSMERVNARLDADDPDYAASATPAANDMPPQPQAQNPTSHSTSDRSQDTAPATSTRNTSTSRPRTGTEPQRRVKVAERWDWAPIEDDDEGNHSTNSVSATAPTRRHDINTAALTKAQLELQGIEAESGEDGRGGSNLGAGDDGYSNGNGVGVAGSKSPAAARISARKKTKRRVDV
jgi:hypothetical protein